MKRNLMAKLGLATTMAFGAMVPMTSMVTAVHAEETQPVGPIDGMWDHHNIENLEIKLDGQLKYNGKEQVQKIKVKDGDIELEEDKDYKIEGNKATELGEYEMKVTGINDFHGEVKVKFTIADKTDISNAQVSLTNTLTENGKDQTQMVSVTYDGKTLKEGTDYIVEGNIANKAGDYQMTISGINEFGGSRSIGFTVKAAPKQLVDISTCDVKLENQLVANGKDQKQGVIVSYKGSQLAEGKDYTVEGNVANKAGQYTMTIKGTGNFQGTVKVTYTVTEAKVDFTKAEIKLENTLTENGKDQEQKIKVTMDGKELKEHTDYIVENNMAKKAGTYTMTVKGMGKYEGSKEVEFKVAEKKAEKEENKEEKTEEKSNAGLYVGAGIGATGFLAAILTFLKFTKH